MSFNPNTVITNPEKLYGRDILLSQLLIHVKRGNNVQLIGMRRFGKTSVLKCLEYKINTELSETTIPIYFDFKEIGSLIKGTANVYRYIISRIIEKLSELKLLDEEIEFKKVSFLPHTNWEDTYIELEKVANIKIQGIFKELLTWFSDYLNKSFYFIFDEYEHLFRFSFDNPEGFMKMRSLSQITFENGLNPFSFIVSGTLTWEHLCTITGSGELNTVGETLFVSPIDFDSFQKMWLKIGEDLPETATNIIKAVATVYDKTGGVPFYAKVIGESWFVSKEKPDFYKLKPFFEEIFLSLKNEEQLILLNLINSKKNIKKNIFKQELFLKGLIYSKKNRDTINGGYFKDFLSLKHSSSNQTNSTNEIEEIVLQISKLIRNINNSHKNKTSKYIFEPTVDDTVLILNLKTPCSTIEQFSDFANSLYKIIFERTKKNRQLDRLPRSFKDNNRFLLMVDTMRHSLGEAHLMDNFTMSSRQLEKKVILQELLGSKNEPNNPEEFETLQIELLKRFKQELNKLNQIIRK